MPLESIDPKGRFWEENSLPVITGLNPGAYSNPVVTIDEFGRVTSASSGGGGSGIGAQNAGVSIVGSPFSILNFTGGQVTGTSGGGGVLDISISASASIAAQNTGVVVPNGPFSTLNFTGVGVVASDGGGGTLEVAVAGATPTDYVQYLKGTGATAASQNIGSPIPATSIVRTLSVTVTTPYSVGGTLQVQDGAANVLMTSNLINPQVAGTYILETPGENAALVNPQIVLAVGGGPAAGACIIDVIYQTP